jgi:methanogenic corrinoid protein MtbC1
MRAGDVAESLRRGEALPSSEAHEKKLPPELKHLIHEFYESLLMPGQDKAELLHGNLQVSLTFQQRLDIVYGPLLERIAGEFETGKIALADAYFASAWIRQILYGFLSAVQPGNSGRVVCATLPGEDHEGGILITAAHFKFNGWKVLYLGTEVPVSEIKKFSHFASAQLVFLSVSDPAILKQEIPNLTLLKKPTFIGGRGAQLEVSSTKDLDFLHLIRQSGESAVREICKRMDLVQPHAR